MRPPTFEPTRMLRASTVPEPRSELSRRNQLAYTAVAATTAATARMMKTRFRFMNESPAWVTTLSANGRRGEAAASPSRAHERRTRCEPAESRLRTATKPGACQKWFAETHRQSLRLASRRESHPVVGQAGSTPCAELARAF